MNWIILILAATDGSRLYILLWQNRDRNRTRVNDVVDWISRRTRAEHVPYGQGFRTPAYWYCLPGGAVGAVVVGIIFFHEPATFWRIFFITTLIISIVGLKVLG